MLTLIECSNLIYRSYFGYPPMERFSDNHPIGVVHGCCEYFWHLARETPSHVAIVFDKGRCKRRLGINPAYKANRPPVPDDLRCQMPLARRAAEAFGFHIVEQDEVEADDLIATYAACAERIGQEVLIVSTDKDMFQLIRPGVAMFDPKYKRPIDAAYVVEKFGVSPEWMVDLQALTGDATDGIEGIFKVGPKTAAKLLLEFGSLEAVLDNAHRIRTDKLREHVLRDADKARAAKLQVKLDDSLPVFFDLEENAYNGFEIDKVIAFLNEMELVTLRDEIEEWMAASVPVPA